MEILSPAGNCNLVESAIKAKSNAVYGGFKLWNARNNAQNFNKEEYNNIIEILHKHNMKFYLTLNNILLDSEIEDIIKYLSQEDLSKPDAFIVADIGLLITLKKTFPSIPIHISTQFGAQNISDLRLLEELGAERVILARETTKKELEYLKKHSSLELEIFIWGSQCLSYSGLCFFGSLINGGTGNRGKCINLCRDIYCAKNKTGTFLYVSDMNCIDIIKELEYVDSLKIEGRRRMPEEVEKIINEIKERTSTGYKAGFLFGKKPDENNMINTINKRIIPKYKSINMQYIDEYDVFMKFENGELTSICESNDTNAYYICSEIIKDYDINKKNYTIELKSTEVGLISEISITNYKGENTVIKDNNNNNNSNSIYTPKKLISEIVKNSNKDINIIKMKYIKPIVGKIKFSKLLVDKVIQYFKEQTRIVKSTNKNDDFQIKSEIYVQTNDMELIKKIKNKSQIKIIYEITSIQTLKNIDYIISILGEKVIYRLPIFNWKSENLKKYYELLEGKEVMFTRYSQINDCKHLKFKKKYCDYLVYSWNKISLQFLKNNGIEEFTATPELSYKQNCNIFENEKVQFIIAGKVPMVYTRNCFKKILNCSKCNKNQENSKSIHNKSKNMNFIISCKGDHKEFYYEQPILNDYSKFPIKDNMSFRVLTNGLTQSEIIKILETLKEKNYYQKLKTENFLIQSYECNLIEGRD